MKITTVKVRILEHEKRKADISIVIDGVLRVDRIGIIDTKLNDKLFLSMPSVRKPNKEWQNVFYPLKQESRSLIHDFLIQFYEYAVSNQFNKLDMELKKESIRIDLRDQTMQDFRHREGKYSDVWENEPTFSVTSFRIHKVEERNNLCAIASLVIDDVFALVNMKIVQNHYSGEYKLIMPSEENKHHNGKNIVYPISRRFREKIEKLMADAYMQLAEVPEYSLDATVLEEKQKNISMQEIGDYVIRFMNRENRNDKDDSPDLDGEENRETEQEKTEQIPAVGEIPFVSLEESAEELMYTDIGCVMQEIIKRGDRDYISGKIVGYVQGDCYKVLLSNGETGIISCSDADRIEKVIDYKNDIFSKFSYRNFENWEEKMLQYINRNCYFANTGLESDAGHMLSIKEPKRDYLHYVVENQCVLKGKIIQIENGRVGIETPFGFVFFTPIKYVFGCILDPMFDYMNYLGAEVSVIIHYEESSDKLYPVIAQQRFQVVNSSLNYVFPSLTRWDQVYYSKLWLPKKVLFQDKHKKYPIKHINQLIVVSRIRDKGETKKAYKANIKKILSEEEAVRFRESILSVGWLTNLKGHHVDTAVAHLEKTGFPYTIQYVYNLGKERGTVLDMQPDIRGKTILPRNIVVELTVSQGKRRPYIMPDIIGMHITHAQELLRKNRIGIKLEFTNIVVEGIDNYCVINTWPPAGKMLVSGKNVTLRLYREAVYESPFALRENERIRTNPSRKIAVSDAMVEQFISVPWQREILEFILKHKIINSLHLRWWIDMIFDSAVLQKEFNDSLKYLLNTSLLRSVSVETDVSKSLVQYIFPHKMVYSIIKEYTGYNGMFMIYGKDPRMLKIRAAENQAFLKLYSLMKDHNTIQYEVDCMQRFVYNEEECFIKIHFAVMMKDQSKEVSVYYIEAIRFLNEEQLLDSWGKLIRYNMYVGKQYDLTPNLILVFENETHYKDFMAARPAGFKFKHMQVLYTWDNLTNNGESDFLDVFMKEDTLCETTI